MRSYWSFIGNDKYDIGCTGQTVYLLNKQGTEIARFKDLIYAYKPGISPRGDIFVIKSADGRLAVYSFSPPSLIKKFRFSKVNCAQHDNFCFSSDGKEFYNIELHVNPAQSALSVYDTRDFTLIKRVLNNDYSRVLTGIEFDAATETIYLLGFFRNAEGIASEFFVGKLFGDELNDIARIPAREHDFYRRYLDLKMSGFSDKTYQWSYFDTKLEVLKTGDYSLAELWKHYRSET